MTRFAEKVVLVTGAARPPGIGRATALRLGMESATVVCVDRVADTGPDTDHATPAAVAALQDELSRAGVTTMAIDADVTSSESVESAVRAVVADHGRIDACCCLSGISGPTGGLGDIVDVGDESWRRCVDVNLTGPFVVASAVARHMIERGGGGAITMLSSYAAAMPSVSAGAIGAARAGLDFLVSAMATEVGRHGIRVNAVRPLGVSTSDGPSRNTGLDTLIERSTGASDRDAWAKQSIPLGRLQAADETAALIVYLTSDDASFVSGQSVSVAGGAPG